jgi:hypothetical protein
VFKNTGRIYSSEAYSDKLESTHVHGVPILMNVKLDISQSNELAERGSITNER